MKKGMTERQFREAMADLAAKPFKTRIPTLPERFDRTDHRKQENKTRCRKARIEE